VPDLVEYTAGGHTFVIRNDSPSDRAVIRECCVENAYRVSDQQIRANVIIDIGANIGAFSIFAASLVPAVTVYAYEPEPENFALLQTNIERNGLAGRICARREAVCAAGTFAVLPNYARSRVSEDLTTGTPVRAVGLDDVFAANGLDECDILKVDAEGSEYPLVDQASRETLSRVRNLAMEYHVNVPEENARLGGLLSRLGETFELTLDAYRGFPRVPDGILHGGGMIYGRRYPLAACPAVVGESDQADAGVATIVFDAFALDVPCCIKRIVVRSTSRSASSCTVLLDGSGGPIPVVDISNGDFSVTLPEDTVLPPGSRLSLVWSGLSQGARASAHVIYSRCPAS
jgi:FkbM family methyltransferase